MPRKGGQSGILERIPFIREFLPLASDPAYQHRQNACLMKCSCPALALTRGAEHVVAGAAGRCCWGAAQYKLRFSPRHPLIVAVHRMALR